MDQDLIDFTARHPALGPNYEVGGRIAEKLIAQFTEEHFLPIIKDFSDKLYSTMEAKIRDYLLSDVECNVQSDVWRQLDACVEALLGKNTWIIEKYCLGERYNCDQIRAAVAAAMPKELQDARIADLEAEVKRLKEDNDWLRRTR